MQVLVKNPADFVGSALGVSEANTKAILAASAGKVLIIDEAYMLASGSGVGSTADPYKTAIVDTLVGEIQSTPGEDRCVLLLGYEEQMEDFFQRTNPGLERRLPLSDAFKFEDFEEAELLQILRHELAKQGLSATDQAQDVAMAVLSRAEADPTLATEVKSKTSLAERNTSSRSACRVDQLSRDLTTFCSCHKTSIQTSIVLAVLTLICMSSSRTSLAVKVSSTNYMDTKRLLL